jgi:hypothetical protein
LERAAGLVAERQPQSGDEEDDEQGGEDGKSHAVGTLERRAAGVDRDCHQPNLMGVDHLDR